jgi:single-strand DNA-binding protein
MFNKLTLVGRLGQDPEISKKGETSLCTFRLATNEFRNKADGGKDTTEWHSITVWGSAADACYEHLAKGSLILVEGRLQSREYTDKDSVKRRSYEVIASTVKFLEPKKNINPKNEVSNEVITPENIPW